MDIYVLETMAFLDFRVADEVFLFRKRVETFVFEIFDWTKNSVKQF